MKIEEWCPYQREAAPERLLGNARPGASGAIYAPSAQMLN